MDVRVSIVLILCLCGVSCLVGYEVKISNLPLLPSLAIYHLISNAPLWNNNCLLHKHLLTSLVNSHLSVAQPSCIIPLDPRRTSYIHFPNTLAAKQNIREKEKLLFYSINVALIILCEQITLKKN